MWGRLFFGSTRCQQHWTPSRSCCLPQDGMDETFVRLLYFTNKKVFQNDQIYELRRKSRKIPYFFLVKSQNEKCRQIPSRKFGAPGILQNTVPEIADWKLLIPLGPDHHCRRHNGWGGHHRLGHHSQGQHAQKACPKGQKAGTKGHQLGIWPQRGLRFLVQ